MYKARQYLIWNEINRWVLKVINKVQYSGKKCKKIFTFVQNFQIDTADRDIRMQGGFKIQTSSANRVAKAVGWNSEWRFCIEAVCFSALSRIVSDERMDGGDGGNP